MNKKKERIKEMMIKWMSKLKKKINMINNPWINEQGKTK